ncbi:hypothetical protein L210DRAFT_3683076 [Boletus edulis BED1]|uniref:Uncharacterized protein n=1 Tax=Boletus edulis BED1 TaxID=1328754 RepID=A0AAD4BCB7_BOLED|nr:hypothetical protein L210DRAFT_3708321 [Boletus edulis BED1]KAF8418662.1 hypothetical protein L210DRAFT_3683076 [Boletus edulis BED1]
MCPYTRLRFASPICQVAAVTSNSIPSISSPLPHLSPHAFFQTRPSTPSTSSSHEYKRPQSRRNKDPAVKFGLNKTYPPSCAPDVWFRSTAYTSLDFPQHLSPLSNFSDNSTHSGYFARRPACIPGHRPPGHPSLTHFGKCATSSRSYPRSKVPDLVREENQAFSSSSPMVSQSEVSDDSLPAILVPFVALFLVLRINLYASGHVLDVSVQKTLTVYPKNIPHDTSIASHHFTHFSVSLKCVRHASLKCGNRRIPEMRELPSFSMSLRAQQVMVHSRTGGSLHKGIVPRGDSHTGDVSTARDPPDENGDVGIVAQGMFQLLGINQMEREMYQYVDPGPVTQREFEEMIHKDFVGPGPYPTYILPHSGWTLQHTKNERDKGIVTQGDRRTGDVSTARDQPDGKGDVSFEEMIHKDFVGPGPYLTYILPHSGWTLQQHTKNA